MLSTATASIAGMLRAQTIEVILASQVRSHSVPLSSLLPFCRWMLSAPLAPGTHGDLLSQFGVLTGAAPQPRGGFLRLARIRGGGGGVLACHLIIRTRSWRRPGSWRFARRPPRMRSRAMQPRSGHARTRPTRGSGNCKFPRR
jgi:hypothetical protein